MVVENLTQRSGEFKEELENILLIKKYRQSACSFNEQAKRKDVKGVQDLGSVRDVASWLNKQGEVMAIGKISQLLRIKEKLNPELLKDLHKQKPGVNDDRGLTIAEAAALTQYDNKEQAKLAEILKESDEKNKIDRLKNLTKYKDAPEEIKEKVRDGKIDIADIEEVVFDKQINEKNKDGDKTIFIPNFESRANDFRISVGKLEQDNPNDPRRVAIRKTYQHIEARRRLFFYLKWISLGIIVASIITLLRYRQ